MADSVELEEGGRINNVINKSNKVTTGYLQLTATHTGLHAHMHMCTHKHIHRHTYIFAHMYVPSMCTVL